MVYETCRLAASGTFQLPTTSALCLQEEVGELQQRQAIAARAMRRADELQGEVRKQQEALADANIVLDKVSRSLHSIGAATRLHGSSLPCFAPLPCSLHISYVATWQRVASTPYASIVGLKAFSFQHTHT